MSDERDSRFYLALVASSVSSVAWLLALGAAGYTGYTLLVGGPSGTAATWTVVAAVVGAVFANLEKRIYPPEEME